MNDSKHTTKEVTLPTWLDNLIFVNLHATYCRVHSDMTVIDWDSDKILTYLGTYFPRSYTESYCIFKHFFQTTNALTDVKSINILDFGCGTGGEIFGLASAIEECRHNIKTMNARAIDGNQHALKKFEYIKDEFNKYNKIKIFCEPSAIKIDDFYDLNILSSILNKCYDIIISFKAVCEFVTKQQFEEKNAYEHLVKFMLPKLTETGVMLLVDITTRNNVAQGWLSDLMDKGLQRASASVIGRNTGNNDTFVVNHSRQLKDISKIAWRLIEK